MIQHKDLFYSFHYDEIRGFDKIESAARALSVIPDDFEVEILKERLGVDRFKNMRASLDVLPDKQQALKTEAKGHLQKALPRISTQVQNTNHKPHEEWSFRPGHIAFNPAVGRCENLNKLVSEFFDFNCLLAGDFLYPPQGFRLWHTNKFDMESWFIFFVDVTQPKGSFFKFIDPETEELITHWDEPGTVNIFKISSNNDDLLWHCIGTNDCNRWSQGFSIPADWKSKVLVNF